MIEYSHTPPHLRMNTLQRYSSALSNDDVFSKEGHYCVCWGWLKCAVNKVLPGCGCYVSQATAAVCQHKTVYMPIGIKTSEQYICWRGCQVASYNCIQRRVLSNMLVYMQANYWCINVHHTYILSTGPCMRTLWCNRMCPTVVTVMQPPA